MKKPKLVSQQRKLNVELLNISEFSRIAKVHAATLRRWDKAGKLLPFYISKNGYRFYTKPQVKMAILLKKDWARGRQLC